jgi:exodeoxyribonuclease VII large subunit
MNLAAAAQLQKKTLQVGALAGQLEALSPHAVLKRGYSITTLKRSGAVVRSAGDVKTGDKLITRLSDGQVESVVDDKNQPRLFE